MTILQCNIDDVEEIAEGIRKADSGLRRILQALDATIQEKGVGWSGDSQRHFMQFFQEWRRGMEIQSYLLRKTGVQLRDATEKYRREAFEVSLILADR